MYGSIDDFATFKSEPVIKECMEKIMDRLNLKYPTTIAKQDQTMEFVGPLEFKGSQTEDCKKYLVDLI